MRVSGIPEFEVLESRVELHLTLAVREAVVHEIVHEDYGGLCSDLVDSAAVILRVGGVQLLSGTVRDYLFSGGVGLVPGFAVGICDCPRVVRRFVVVAHGVEYKVASGISE